MCVLCGRAAAPQSLLSVMKDLASSSANKPDGSDLDIFDLYEMTGQGGDADKVLPTLVKVAPKL